MKRPSVEYSNELRVSFINNFTFPDYRIRNHLTPEELHTEDDTLLLLKHAN